MDPSAKALHRFRQDRAGVKNSEAAREYSKLSLEIGKMQQRRTVVKAGVNGEAERSEQDRFLQRREDDFNSKRLYMTDSSPPKSKARNQHVPQEFFTERQTQYPSLNLGPTTFQASSYRKRERPSASEYFDDQLLTGTQEYEKACRWARKQQQARMVNEFEVK